MIKLNNKNITYVALADSSNSLKAPKEIWYADSSNSVKLVYRRKDALIEGEDYEKYHWLVGDGDATITHEDVDAFEVKVLELDTTGVNYAKGYIVNGGTRFTRLYIGQTNSGGNYSGLLIFREVGKVVANYRTPSLNIELGEHIITKTAQTDQIGVFTDDVRHIKNATSDVNYVGTKIISNQLIPHQNLYIGYLSSPNIHNLIPCKLLKPVPKWLDANGIRRQVGECGMIDLISGKFYGNVNSVGTFTVENYYERKEWLQGRNGAYINTEHLVKTYEDAFEVYARYDGTNRNPDGEEQNPFGIQDGNIKLATYISNNNSINAVIKQNENYSNYNINIHKEVFKIALYAPNSSEYVKILDGVSYTNPIGGTVNNDTNLKMYVFARNGKANSYFHGDIAYFKITDTSSNTKMNLIPCTLIMDLPASMDANNIPRTKGTSGMWDLVSDRFYGNVASSGTFKAVNLAEGVDFVRAQWLVGDDTAYIQGVTYDVWNNKIQLKTGRWNGEMRSVLSYYKSTNTMLIYKNSDSAGTYLLFTFREDSSNYSHIGDIRPFSSVPENLDVEFFIENAQFYCKQNGVVIPNTAPQTAVRGSWTSINPKIYSAKMSYIREVLPNGSYRSNLIPVKLLRPLPSKYDANGIARQAGECGMYDTVNDVFYGNVASSGSFSCVNDS